MRDEALVGRIVAAMVAAVDVPVTLKIRTGWDSAHRNAPTIARKHLGWYAKDRPENAAFRAVVNQAETSEAQLALTRRYFDALQSGEDAALASAA